VKLWNKAEILILVVAPQHICKLNYNRLLDLGAELEEKSRRAKIPNPSPEAAR
jgi:hypothetical protein